MKILVEFRQGDVGSPVRVRLLKEAPSSVDPFGDTAQATQTPKEVDVTQEMQVVQEIAKSLKNKQNETARMIVVTLLGYRPSRWTPAGALFVARAFWQQAKGKLPVKPTSKFKFLGAGAIGLAFEVDGMVLKLETQMSAGNWKSTYASVDKLNRASNAQWDKNDAATDTPMVYDRGTLEIESTMGAKFNIHWFLIEKFETFDGSGSDAEKSYKRTINTVVQNVRRSFAYKREKLQPEFDNLVANIKRKASKMARYSEAMAHYRLQDTWVEKLAAAMIRMNQLGVRGDYHMGNLGIRRTGGPEGYTVFFD